MQKRKTIFRYVLFQIPEVLLLIFVALVIDHFYPYPFWIFWVVFCGSVLKDIVLFNKTWKSYVIHSSDEYSNVIGKTGLATKDIQQTGYINIAGELWKVEVKSPVKAGDQLIVKAVKGLKLEVEKIN